LEGAEAARNRRRSRSRRALYARRGARRRPAREEEADGRGRGRLERARDLVQRDFSASRANEEWVADITYLRTWNGFVYLAFILDCYSRMIVGWQLATHLRSELVLDAVEMANGLREPDAGLIAHSDRGSQPEFKRPSQRCRFRQGIVMRWLAVRDPVDIHAASAIAEVA